MHNAAFYAIGLRCSASHRPFGPAARLAKWSPRQRLVACRPIAAKMNGRNSFAAARAYAQTAERAASVERSPRAPVSPRPQGAVAAAAAALACLPKFYPAAPPPAEPPRRLAPLTRPATLLLGARYRYA